MKKFIIYGAGDFAQMVKHYIETNLEEKVVAYTVEKKFISKNLFNELDVPVIPFENVDSIYSPDKYFMVIGVVGRQMFMQRKKIYEKIKEKKYIMPNIIHTTASVNTKIIGDSNIIMDNSVIGPMCEIGCGNIIWPCVSIAHQNIVGDFNQFAGCSSTIGQISIGSHCFIGNNCTLYAKIADYSFIGAGTYIRKDTEEYGVYTTPREIKLNKKSTDIF